MGPRGRFYPYLYILHILDCLGQDMQVLYLGRAPRTKETMPDFLKWRRVTRPPLVFRGLTGSQRTPGFWGVTTSIDKEMFKLVITCKYSLKNGNKFQPCPIWDDNNMYRMLKLINTTGMEEIELYLQLVCVKLQVNQSIGTYIDLLLGGNINVE